MTTEDGHEALVDAARRVVAVIEDNMTDFSGLASQYSAIYALHGPFHELRDALNALDEASKA